MSLNLSALKKSSSKDLLNKLNKQVEDSEKKFGNKDDRFWTPAIDAAGNGSAIIRFLPAKTEDALPYVKTHTHAFQENGKWFINECPTTIGKECPICTENRALWASGLESDKEIGRARGRSTKYVANVYIVKDPANPENEGQVRLFRFGKKIFDKLKECFQVDADLGEEARNPYAFFDGMNFNMKIQTVSKFLNYDKCKFVPAADLFDGDIDKLTALMESMHDLDSFLDPKLFKSDEELMKRYREVVGGGAPAKNFEDGGAGRSAPQEKFSKPAPQDDDDEMPWSGKSESTGGAKQESTASVEEDDDLDFFRKLAED